MNVLDYAAQIMPSLIRGMGNTMGIFILTLLFALPLGMPIALARISRLAPLRFVAGCYIWVFRGTPLMLQLFFFYFFLPRLGIGLTFSRFTTAVLTFVFNYAAYFAEIYRAGIQSIDRGQYEAAKSLGVSHFKTMWDIIIPQTFSRILPPVSNEVITLVKDTALAAVIAVPELLKAAKDCVNRDTNPYAYLISALIYLAITFVLTLLSKQLEKKFSRHLKREGD